LPSVCGSFSLDSLTTLGLLDETLVAKEAGATLKETNENNRSEVPGT